MSKTASIIALILALVGLSLFVTMFTFGQLIPKSWIWPMIISGALLFVPHIISVRNQRVEKLIDENPELVRENYRR